MKKITIALTIVILAILSALSLCSVSAAEEALVVTGSNYEKLSIVTDGGRAFCAQRQCTQPPVGTQYTKTTFPCPPELETVAIAIICLNDGSETFATASQYATWQVFEPDVPMSRLANLRHGEEISNKVNELLAYNPVGNWEVEISFYEAEGYQTIVVFTATEVLDDPIIVPTEGTTATEPTEGTTATEPTEGTTVTEPTEGTTATEPTEGTTVTEPTEGTTATEPTEGATDATSATNVPVFDAFDVPKTGDVNINGGTVVMAIAIVAVIATVAVAVLRKKNNG